MRRLAVVAAETGNTPVVLWLIETYNVAVNSASVAKREEDTLMEGRDVYNTPLEAATDTGEEETALALLGLEGQDMNVDSYGQDGQCVLSYAANNDMVRTALALVNHGARMTFSTAQDPRSPLCRAAEYGSIAVLTFFLRRL